MLCEELDKYKITVSSLSGSKSYYPSDIVDKAISELSELLRKSEQSREGAGNIVKTFSKNVRTNNPKCGDILVLRDYSEESYDEWGNYTNTPIHEQYFVDFDTLDFDNLEIGCKAIGVVVENDNGNVLVQYYKGFNDGDNEVVWASAWLYELTNIQLDDLEHKIILTSDIKDELVFSYTSNHLVDFCEQLDKFLREHQNSYSWHCSYAKNYNGKMSCIVIVDNINSMWYKDIIKSGCTENKNMSFMIDEQPIGDSLLNTNILGEYVYQDINGNIRALFPLFYWTRYLSHRTKIHWFVPNKEQYKKIYNNVNKINKSLESIGGVLFNAEESHFGCVRSDFRSTYSFSTLGNSYGYPFYLQSRASFLAYVNATNTKD